jgi:hypothetical protein
MLAIMFRLFDFIALKDFLIICLSNISILRVQEESFLRNVLCYISYICAV